MATGILRTTVILFYLLLVSCSPVGASHIIDTIDPLLKAGEFEKAREKIHQFLAEDPQSVDAYMMLGNLEFTEYMNSIPQIELASNTDESVFVTGIGSIKEATVTVPREVGEEVAAHLQKALSIDSTRGDIHRGLAYVFAVAQMKDELAAQFQRMKRVLPEDESLPYDMSGYAGMFKERGRPEWSLELYEQILALYPGHSGVLSDKALFYFEKGQTVKAAQTADLALKGANVNRKTLGDCMLILTISGDYRGGLEASRRMSRTKGDSVYLVYSALMKYAEENEDWRKDLETYSGKDTSGQEEALVEHLLNPDYKGSVEDFARSDQVVQSVLNRLLLYRAGMRLLPGEATSFLNYAIVMSAYRNYAQALPAFAKAESLSDTLTDDRREALNLFYAWTLQDSGRNREADRRWRKLLGVDTFYADSAASWFLGRNLYLSGKKGEALEMFLAVSDRASESKYATYARNAVYAINGGREPAFAR